MTLFQGLKQNFSSISHYDEIINKPLNYSFKVFLLFFVIFGFAISIFLTLYLSSTTQQLLLGLLDNAGNVYPPELVLTIKDGQVSTNVQEPYSIPISVIQDNFKLNNETTDAFANKKTNFLVIDTAVNSLNFENYDTLFLLTKTSLTYPNQRGLTETAQLKIKNLVLSKEVVDSLVAKYSAWLNIRLVAPVIFGLSLVYFGIMMPIGKILYLILFSLVGLFLAKISEVKITYKQSYQIGLHLILITTLLFTGMGLLGIGVQTIPFLQFAVLSGFMIWVFSNMKNTGIENKTTDPS